LCVVAFPEAGPLAALLMLAIGVTAFVLQRGTEPPVHPYEEHHQGSIIRSSEIQLLILLMVALGTIVGVVDVVSVAFAEQQGQPAAANIFGLSLAVFVAGLFFAPTLIVAMALVERIVPPAKLTEGLTWLVTGLSIGVAIGAASSGWLVDAFGARSGFWVAIAAGAVVLGSAVQSYRHLK